jgi:hypothetical protein
VLERTLSVKIANFLLIELLLHSRLTKKNKFRPSNPANPNGLTRPEKQNLHTLHAT